MEYELYLRTREPEADVAQALGRIVAEEAGVAADDARRTFRLELPDGVLEAHLHPGPPEADPAAPRAPHGVDLRIPGGANPALAEAAVARAFDWAKVLDLTVYDPQLGREVHARDADTITARVARLAEYLTDTVGMDGGQAEARIDVEPPRPPVPLRTKFYLALAAALVLLALWSRYCG